MIKTIKIDGEEYKKAKELKEKIRKKYGIKITLKDAYKLLGIKEFGKYKKFFEEIEKIKKENETIFKNF